MTHRGPFDPDHPFGRASTVSKNGKRIKRQVHLPEDVYQEVREAACAEGLRMATWVRAVLREKLHPALHRRLP